jgi:hypothetical protein
MTHFVVYIQKKSGMLGRREGTSETKHAHLLANREACRSYPKIDHIDEEGRWRAMLEMV